MFFHAAPAATQTVTDLPASDPLRQEWRWAHCDGRSGLPISEVVGVVESPGGRLWAATRGGVAWFDNFRWRPLYDHGLPGGRFERLIATETEEVIVLAAGMIFQGDTAGFRPLSDTTTALRITGMAPLGNGQIAVATESGLGRLSAGTVEPDPLYQGPLAAVGGAGEHAWTVVEGVLYSWRGGEWVRQLSIGRVDASVVASAPGENLITASLGPLGSTVVVLAGGITDRLELPVSQLPLAVAIHPSGDAAVAFSSGHLYVRRSGRWFDLATLPAEASGPSAMAFTRNGDLWIGSDRGLTVNRSSSSRWSRWDPDLLPDGFQLVNVILPIDGDSVWVGTNDGLAVRSSQGDVRRITDALGQPVTGITGLARDRDGGIWVTSGGRFPGAFRYLNGNWTRFGPADGLADTPIHAIAVDRSGDLWFLGLSSQFGVDEPGVHRLRDGVIEHWTPGDGLISGRVYSFAEGLDGAFWFGTAEGLSRWRNGEWTHWQVTDGLRQSAVYALATDGDGRIWLGHSTGAGGVGFVGTDGRLVYPFDQTALADARVRGLSVDSRGRVWAGSFKGVARINGDDVTLISSAEGLAAPLVWPTVPLDDRVLIGTIGSGVLELSLEETLSPPPVVVVQPPVARLGGVAIEWQAFAYQANVSPPDVPTRYQVDGAGWSPWSVGRSLGPLNLTSGEHRVEVQAKGILGGIGPVASIVIQIPPPLWRHPLSLMGLGVWILSMLVGAAFYLHRRRVTLATLQDREAKYRALFENALVGIGRLRVPDGAVLAANERMAEIFGYADADTFAQDFTVVRHVAPEAMARLGEMLSAEAGEGPIEARIERLDGSTGWVRVWAYVNEADGYVEGALEDITTQKLVDQERERLSTQLQQSQKMETVGQLTGGVAHDFNNLLTVVHGNLDLVMAEWGDGDPERREYVEQALAAARRGGQLTHRLLAFARKQPLRPRDVDLFETLSGMSMLLRRAIGEEVAINLDLASGLWRCLVDRNQFENAILNLSINARDAMPGGGQLSISATNIEAGFESSEAVDGLAPGEYVCVSVADTGTGMEPHVQARAMEPFFTTKEVGRGTGLGLSMVFGFAKQSGGHLSIQTRMGEGTTMLLYLPRSTAQVSPAPEGAVRGSRPTGQGLTVLVVEDNEPALTLVDRMLRLLDYRALVAGNGEAALEILRGPGPIDLLLTDVILPGGMDGIQLGTAALELRPELKVLFMSGYSDGVLGDRGGIGEEVHLLEKPFSLDQLAEALKEAADEPH